MHTADSISYNLVIKGETITEEGIIINEILSYYSTLYSEQGGQRPSWSHANIPFISEEDNVALQCPFSEEEVFGVIKDPMGDKTPGPNGFTMGFFKKCWNVISFDLLKCFCQKLKCHFLCSYPKKDWS